MTLASATHALHEGRDPPTGAGESDILLGGEKSLNEIFSKAFISKVNYSLSIAKIRRKMTIPSKIVFD